MSEQSQKPMFAGDCPRCGQLRTTFDVLAATQIDFSTWPSYESFLRCRKCFGSSIALLSQDEHNAGDPMSIKGQYVNGPFAFKGWVLVVPGHRITPEHVPAEIDRIFHEASTCAAIGAFDAAGTMFRKVLDSATRAITPKPDSSADKVPSNWKTYKDLRLRLNWLFDQQLLSPALSELSSCIHEDGNDAAHDLIGISEAEAQDLGDFCESVLEALYTVPGQIEENRKRRDERRRMNAPEDTAAAS